MADQLFRPRIYELRVERCWFIAVRSDFPVTCHASRTTWSGGTICARRMRRGVCSPRLHRLATVLVHGGHRTYRTFPRSELRSLPIVDRLELIIPQTCVVVKKMSAELLSLQKVMAGMVGTRSSDYAAFYDRHSPERLRPAGGAGRRHVAVPGRYFGA